MNMTPLEVRAIDLLFPNEGNADEISRDIAGSTMHVVERQHTGVGCYVTLELRPPLREIPLVRARDFSFNHPRLRYGGSFNANVKSEHQLVLEMVALGGEHWPDDLDAREIREMLE